MHQEHRDAPGAPGCAGSTGRRCGLKAPPRGSRGELPGTGSGCRQSPGARAGPRCEAAAAGRGAVARRIPPAPPGRGHCPGKCGVTGTPGRDGAGADPAATRDGTTATSWLASRGGPCQHGPLSAQSHQPPRKSPVQHRGTVSASFQKGIKLMHEIRFQATVPGWVQVWGARQERCEWKITSAASSNFFFFPLLAKVFKIRGGEKEQEQPGPSGQRAVAFPERCAPFPAPWGCPDGLCQMHCVPIPAGCCSSMGNAPKVHIPSTSCRSPCLLVPHGGSRARQCHRHSWQQGERSRVGSGSFRVLGPRGGVTPPLITLSS